VRASLSQTSTATVDPGLIVLLVDESTDGPNTAYYRGGSGADDEVTVGRWSE